MVEYIGFFISLLALVYLFVKQNSLPRSGERNGSSYESQEGDEVDPFSAIMKEMERRANASKVIEESQEEEVAVLPLPPVKPQSGKKKRSSPSLQERHLTSSLKERHLRSSLEKSNRKSKKNDLQKKDEQVVLVPPPSVKSSRGGEIVKRLQNRRDMVIYQEIIGKPKSLRTEVYYQ